MSCFLDPSEGGYEGRGCNNKGPPKGEAVRDAGAAARVLQDTQSVSSLKSLSVVADSR